VEKNKQLESAVQWCRENNVRGHAAIKTGQFSLIKDRETINRRLDGKIINGFERQCAILMEEEARCQLLHTLRTKIGQCKASTKQN